MRNMFNLMFILFDYFAALSWKFHNSLQKWFSMGYVVLPSVKRANFANLFCATRMYKTYSSNYLGVNSIINLMEMLTLHLFDCMKA